MPTHIVDAEDGVKILVRDLSAAGDPVVTEGEYRQERVGRAVWWRLKRFRLTLSGRPGQWHRVHANQRKPYGGFPTELSQKEMEHHERRD